MSHNTDKEWDQYQSVFDFIKQLHEYEDPFFQKMKDVSIKNDRELFEYLGIDRKQVEHELLLDRIRAHVCAGRKLAYTLITEFGAVFRPPASFTSLTLAYRGPATALASQAQGAGTEDQHNAEQNEIIALMKEHEWTWFPLEVKVLDAKTLGIDLRATDNVDYRAIKNTLALTLTADPSCGVAQHRIVVRETLKCLRLILSFKQPWIKDDALEKLSVDTTGSTPDHLKIALSLQNTTDD